jgi:hypothetical protein
MRLPISSLSTLEWTPVRPTPGLNRSLWSTRVLGIVATVILHLMFAMPLVLGVAEKKKHTPESDGTVAAASRGEQYESMILLDLSALSPSEADPSPPIDSEGITPEELELQLVSSFPISPPELAPENFEQDETDTKEAGDPAGNAALFGRYMGQIAARIERAWMRPRSAIEGGTFECRVRIAQSSRGIVESIELQNCAPDDAWRESLISAIQRASPLSAPPEPRLFTPTLTLNFTGQQYVANQTPEHDYEPVAARVAMSTAPRTSSRGADQDLSRPAALDGKGDVDLTIVGSDVSWAKKKPAATSPR